MQHETWWMVLAFIVISEFHSALAAWERTCTPFTKSFGPHPRGLCGSNIDETLSFLCVGGYNDHNHRRHHRGKRNLNKGCYEDGRFDERCAAVLLCRLDAGCSRVLWSGENVYAVCEEPGTPGDLWFPTDRNYIPCLYVPRRLQYKRFQTQRRANQDFRPE